MKSIVGRYLKLCLKIAAILFIAVFATAFLIGLFYGDDVKKLLLTNLNKNLNTEIQVQEVHFSILRHFPYASVNLEHVVALDAMEGTGKDTLLKGEHISLLFNLAAIFGNDLKVKQIILRDSRVAVWVDAEGNNNYHFWKSSGDSVGSTVRLEKVILDNVHITYDDARNRQRYSLLAKRGELSGEFSKHEFGLEADADLFVDYFYSGNVNYVPKKEAKIKSRLLVDTGKGIYRIMKSQIRIAGLVMDVAGEVTDLKEGTGIGLKINTHQSELADLLTLLPSSMTDYFSDFKSEGKFVCQADISGESGKNKTPDVSLTFSLANGLLSPKKSSVTFDHLVLEGSFKKSKSNPSELFINSFNGKLNGRPVGGNLRISDFENPYLTLYAKADLDLNSLRAFISHDTLETLDGDMGLDVRFAGNLKDFRRNVDAGGQIRSSGSVRLANVSFKLKENPLVFKSINGNFAFHDNNIEISSLDGMIASTDFHLDGMCRNLVPFILVPDQDAEIRATITSSLIELNELLSNKTTTTVSDTSYKMEINPRLICNLDLSAKQLVFRKFEAKDINGKIRIQDQVISSQGLHFKSMSGDVTMTASINASRNDSVVMSCKADFEQLDITQLFADMENFGQATITDRNLKGRFSAGVSFSSSWSTDLVINPAKVVVAADLTVYNGELIDFKPVLALSKYLKLADLRHIRFSTLKNQIQIRDRKIFFPGMEIKSTAIDLNASGTHDFDNKVDYKLNMLLSAVLGKKIKDQNTEFGVVEDDGLGHSRLFLTMKGPVDNPRFGYDQKGVSEKIKSDLAADKQNVKQLLKQEFGMFKKDTTLKAERKVKKEEMEVDWEDAK